MGKIKYLESIRGIGALAVVFFHFLEIFFPAFLTGDPAQQHLGGGIEWLVYSTPLRLLVNGPAAVTIFFVLSGYVLTYKFFNTQNTEHLASGAIRRYFRLAPVVLAVELLAYLCLRFSLYQYVLQMPAITHANTWINAYNTPADLTKILSEALSGVFVGYQNQYDVPLWTMTYEFYGSLLVFSAAFIGSKMRHRMWLFVVLVFFFRNSYFSDFVLGMILSDLSQRPDQPLRRWIHPWLNTILGIAGLFLLSFPTYTNFADQTIYAFMHIHALEDLLVVYYYTWGAFLVLLAVLNSEKTQEILSIRPFVFLGRISFPLYAVHWILLGSVSAFLFYQFVHFVSYPLAFLITFAISLPLMLVAADLIQRYVDRPGTKASRWIYQKFFQPKPVYVEQPEPVFIPKRPVLVEMEIGEEERRYGE